jgi:hypothetical protein
MARVSLIYLVSLVFCSAMTYIVGKSVGLEKGYKRGFARGKVFGKAGVKNAAR